MTVMYSSHVATATFPGFVRAVLFWKGSIWKLVYSELCIWCLLFLLFTLIYRLALNDEQQKLFENVCTWCYKYAELIPFAFMLGYYITLVISRWSRFWINLGFLDSICISTITYLRHGDLVRAQIYRRNIVRLVCCFQVLVFRIICKGVRRKYPTLQSLVDAGYINEDELPQFLETKFWMPIKWCYYLVRQARKEGLIQNDFGVQKIYEYLGAFRVSVISLWLADWVPVPLAYTQVVYASIRIYFLALVFGRQFLNTDRSTVRSQIDIYVPILTIIQFILYVGWCKMGEALVNPFGDDDDDYDYNFVMTRNLNVGMDIVTGIEARQPLLIDDEVPAESPSTLETAKHTDEAIGLGSIANMDVRRRSSRAPVIMVKRSEVNALKQAEGKRLSKEDLSAITSHYYHEACPVNGRPRTISIQNLSKPLEIPRVYYTQHSCPSKITDEKDSETRLILSTLMEADESSSDHSSEEEKSEIVLEGNTGLVDEISIYAPRHLITPSRQNSADFSMQQQQNGGFATMPSEPNGAAKQFSDSSKGKSCARSPDNKVVVEISDDRISEERESELSNSESFDSNSDNILIIPVDTCKKK